MKSKFRTTSAILLLAMILLISCNSLGANNSSETAPSANIVKVIDLGELETNSIIRGRDGGYSGIFDGRSIWLYGDTVLEQKDQDGKNWHHNSWSWTKDIDPSDGISGFQERLDSSNAPTEFFPLTSDEKAFNDAHFGDNCSEKPCNARWALWPGAIVADKEQDRALIFYSKIYAEPGDLNFYAVGYSVAVWHDFNDSPERSSFNLVEKEPTLLFNQNEPAFGSSALVEGSMLYIYGIGSGSSEKLTYLAKVSLKDALNLNAWLFYAGEGQWVKELNEAKAVFKGNNIMSISFNEYLGEFIAIYSQPISRSVMLRTSSRPEGPWSKSVKIFDAKAPNSTNGWIYDALTHPEYSQAKGKVMYVTYSRVTGFFASEIRLVSVELEKLVANSH